MLRSGSAVQGPGRSGSEFKDGGLGSTGGGGGRGGGGLGGIAPGLKPVT